MNGILKQTKKRLPLFLLLTFSILIIAFQIYKGDDFVWKYLYDGNFDLSKASYIYKGAEDIKELRNPNGRYFTNIITFIVANNEVIKAIILGFSLSGLMLLMKSIVSRNKTVLPITFILFFTMPIIFFDMIINWFSGSTNYIISLLFPLTYILLIKKTFEKRDFTNKISYIIITLFLGIVGALCIENLTIYNIILAISGVIFICVMNKKLYILSISYLVGAIIGGIIMFSNPIYNLLTSSDVQGGDPIAKRNIGFSYLDIVMKIHREIMPYFSKKFFYVHIVILLSFLVIYSKSSQENWDNKRKKYVKASFSICLLYAIYSVLTTCWSDIQIVDPQMRLQALETAFAFVYCVCIIYLSYVFFEKIKFIKVTFFVVSTIMVTLPFIVVDPITSRCFFATFCFWVLTAVEIMSTVLKNCNINIHSSVNKSISFIAITFGCYLLFVNGTNKYVDNIRMDYIKEQLDSGKTSIEVIKHPYKKSDGGDTLSELVTDLYGEDEKVARDFLYIYFDHYGIELADGDLENINFRLISLKDYRNS